jgi:hypothetical protein
MQQRDAMASLGLVEVRRRINHRYALAFSSSAARDSRSYLRTPNRSA